MKEPDPDIDYSEALKAYQNLHPKFEFPEDFPDSRKMEILKKSTGRKMIFIKEDKEYRVYFDDKDEKEMDIPSWNRLIGCGG